MTANLFLQVSYILCYVDFGIIASDALALAFMELADKGFWLKDDRLRHEMHAFADKPLDSYGVTLGLNGVKNIYFILFVQEFSGKKLKYWRYLPYF